ncbi:hypothetical protein HQQ94_02760 [Shewanella sp. VB17]|uniref:hypothetical protein n=1 Tax=Shewanella sp. VB17 TaxID=2739432 RepID=UPI0015656913|nr:hypothetical protein [Shewanella sp. VB17]NRD72175.1 hypothetical protein [Shewanella sp. VB17]
MKQSDIHFDVNSWERFAKLFEKKWLYFGNKEKILSLTKNDSLMAMVISQVGRSPETWLSTKVAALDNKTPLWCINNGRDKKLKMILMNMSW